MLDDGALMHDLSVRRLGRVAMYAGLVLSGALLIVSPSDLVSGEVSHIIDRLWSISMVISALACFAGAATDRWFGEYVGIPLLASVIAFYGGAALLAADLQFAWYRVWFILVPRLDVGSLTLVAFAILILSFALGLAARWQDVRAIKQAASMVGAANGGD